ncbi:MAG TPA: tetratricopeptide repeat protein [Candidatus Acidoferrales bacterium]|nr:tetratricopeptide repeat protein [Candidatus Acidoferrales bacterium]
MTTPTERTIAWLAPALVLLAPLAVYARTLGFQFVFDDSMFILSNPFVHSASNIPRFFTEPVWSGIAIAQKNYYRPVFLIWVLANYSVFGTHAAGWHVTALLLHCFNSFLVYLVALRLVREPLAAGLGTALFALHPVQAETVSWICCTNDLLASFFVLVSLLSYLRARESTGSHSVAWWAVSAASYAAGALSKEPAIALPILFVLLEWSGRPASRSAEESVVAFRLPANLAMASYFTVAVAYSLFRRIALGSFLGSVQPPIGYRTELLTIPSVLATYLGHLVWPVNLSPFYDVAYQTTVTASGVVLPVLLLVILAAFAVWAAVRSASARFPVTWSVLFWAPALHIAAFPRGELVHDRFLYLPMAGIGMLAAIGFASASRPASISGDTARTGNTLTYACAALLLALALISARQTGYWGNNYELFRRGVEIAPLNGIAAGNLGIEYLKAGDRAMAAELLRRADALNPDTWEADKEQAYAHFLAGRYQEAEQALGVALVTRPNDGFCHFLLGLTYLKTGRPTQAVEEARRAVALSPREPGLHYGLAKILEATGDLAGAREEYRAELVLRPDHQPSLDKLHELDQRLAASPTH